MNRQSRALFCPACPEGVIFPSSYALKLHLCSDAHFNCAPYPCALCRQRFPTHQELRRHCEEMHGETGRLAYLQPDESVTEKRRQVNAMVELAELRQRGLARPPQPDGASVVTGVPADNVGSQLPVAVERAAGDPLPMLAASVASSISQFFIPPHQAGAGGLAAERAVERVTEATVAAAIAIAVAEGPIAEQPAAVAEGDAAVDNSCCCICKEEVGEGYPARRQHVFDAHAVEVEGGTVQAKQAHLQARMAQCFPGARVLNDMTCNQCAMELQGPLTQAASQQTAHVQEHHVRREELALCCPLEECAVRDQLHRTVRALEQHIQHCHGGMARLGGDARKSHQEAVKRAAKKTAQVATQCFPFTPKYTRRKRPAAGEKTEEQ